MAHGQLCRPWLWYIILILVDYIIIGRYLLLIYAPSSLRCLLLSCVSWALSDPARSTNISLPNTYLSFFTIIWQMAWDLEDVSLWTVWKVALAEFPAFIIVNNCLASAALFSVSPSTCILLLPSSRIRNCCFLFNKSRHLPP